MNLKSFFQIFIKAIFASFACLIMLVSIFQFQSVPASASIKDLDVLGIQCIVGGDSCLIESAINFLINAAIPLAVLVIMWGGYKYFFSGLIEGQTNGKKTIQAGIIGLIIVLIAKAITVTVQGSVTNGGFATGAATAFLNNTIDFLFGVSAVLAALVIVWGGYQYLFSGLPGTTKTGQENIQRGIIGLIVVLIARALADVIKNTINGQSTTLTLKTDPIVNFIKIFLSGFFIPIVSVITVVFFVLAGYYFITANGNKETETKGKNALQNTVIGLIIVLLATTIAQLVVSFFPATSSSGSSTTNSNTTNTNTGTGTGTGTNPTISPTGGSTGTVFSNGFPP